MQLKIIKKGKYWYVRGTISFKNKDGEKHSFRIDETTRETEKEAAQQYKFNLEKQLRSEVINGEKPKKTWLDAEKRWLEENGHQRTIKESIRYFEWLEKYIPPNLVLNAITKDTIEAIAKQREVDGKKPATVNRVLELIRVVLNKACKDWEWLDKVPYIRMRSKNNQRVRYLTEQEMESLLSHSPSHLKNAILLSLHTGQRESNVVKMEWSEIDLVKKTWTIPKGKFKTNKFHVVPLNDIAIEILASLKGKHPQYVLTYSGKPVVRFNNHAFKTAKSKAGIVDFHWHDIRHTTASWMVQRGAPELAIIAFFGWESRDMLKRYAHLAPHNLTATANILISK